MLVVAGEEDDLSPIEYSWSLLERASGPRELVLFQGEKHGISGGPAAGGGPNRDEIMADWLLARLTAQPMPEDQLRYVTTAGTVIRSPLFAARTTTAHLGGRGAR